MAPQHGSLSLYTKIEGPSIAKIDFYFPRYGLWIMFEELYKFIVTTLDRCVKQPLVRARTTSIIYIYMCVCFLFYLFIFIFFFFFCSPFWRKRPRDANYGGGATTLLKTSTSPLQIVMTTNVLILCGKLLNKSILRGPILFSSHFVVSAYLNVNLVLRQTKVILRLLRPPILVL